jgi:hypothetical protein
MAGFEVFKNKRIGREKFGKLNEMLSAEGRLADRKTYFRTCLLLINNIFIN